MDSDPLLPGFRFYPTEEELVSFYLYHKIRGTRTNLDRVIPVVDIYDYNPWDLPEFAGELCRQDNEQWFFFIPRQEREARGGRPNRLTTEGYWKATGSPGEVYSSTDHTVIGRKRTMVFYIGRAPNGHKTVWKMNEYKALYAPSDHASSSSSTPIVHPRVREGLSICRLYKRSRTLRAFDRRPFSDTAAAANFQQYYDSQPAMAAAPTDQWSLDSSSSGRRSGGAPPPENENNPAESEAWWNSEDFDFSDL
ncbi:NAC domain-containing protein 90-like [Andrographis paniculata]|uniref:NAC domain-containing protein 90-like n=1 Tax=Andrographis paniculata TaxID=175694 RepID=UPI0021E8F4C2|nr:NAC domain-containing protein 90-like [Andrographis paniculata]